MVRGVPGTDTPLATKPIVCGVPVAAVVLAQSQITALVWLNVVVYVPFARVRLAVAFVNADHDTPEDNDIHSVNPEPMFVKT